MNILFILYHGMACNSAHHVAGLARCLTAQGDACVVAVPDTWADAGRGDSDAGAAVPADVLRVVPYRLLKGDGIVFEGGSRPDVVVAWTPRENVRVATERALRRWRVPLVVHLEDNEDAITARYVGVPYEAVVRATWWSLRKVSGLAIAHPRRMRALLRRANAVSMVMDRLAEFVPETTPSTVFWPGYEEGLFDATGEGGRGAREAVLRTWGVPESSVALVYTGNVHCGNRDDMETLYQAVVALNRGGVSARLLRCGETHIQDYASVVRDAAPFVVELGLRPRAELPGLLQAADVLVQPGGPGPFNDYRFPSKLPEYLVSGRPVVLARTNLGRHVTDGREAIVVPEGSVRELADAVRHLAFDPDLAGRVGRHGRDFARRELCWSRAAVRFRSLLMDVVESEALSKQGATRP